MARKSARPCSSRYTITHAGLQKLLNVLNDELRGGPDGFVTATVYPDGCLSINKKDGTDFFGESVEIFVESTEQ